MMNNLVSLGKLQNEIYVYNYLILNNYLSI